MAWYIVRLGNGCLMPAWREDGSFVGWGTWSLADLWELLSGIHGLVGMPRELRRQA